MKVEPQRSVDVAFFRGADRVTLLNHLGHQQRKVGEFPDRRHVAVARQDSFDEGGAGSWHTDDEDRPVLVIAGAERCQRIAGELLPDRRVRRQLARGIVTQRAAIAFCPAIQRGERTVVLLQIFVLLGECEAGGNDEVEPTRLALQPLFEVGDVVSFRGLGTQRGSQMQRAGMKRIDLQQRREVFLGLVDPVDVEFRERDVGE